MSNLGFMPSRFVADTYTQRVILMRTNYLLSFLTSISYYRKSRAGLSFVKRVLCVYHSDDNVTNMLIKRFIATAVGKINKFRLERLHELEAPWLTE